MNFTLITLKRTLFLLAIVTLITILIPNSQLPMQNENVELPNLSTANAKPKRIGFVPPPVITARSVLVIDAKTDDILLEKNPELKLAPASLTKLATALVVSEKCLLDQVVTVPPIATSSGTKMGLVPGEKITVENLLYGLLLPSGNDAADVLVSACFKDYEEFLSSVKNLTQKLGMTNTQFKNPSGLPEKGHFSTANDLAKLTKATLANKEIGVIVATKEKVVTDSSGKISHKLTNLNKLLDDLQVLGVKTGRTNIGENLIILKENGEHRIISIILQSDDRFLETEKILNWVFENFVWEPVAT